MKVFFKSDANINGFESVESNEFLKKVKSNDLFRLVNVEGFDNPIKFSSVIEYAENVNLDILIVNENSNPKIVKVLDMQKHIYELKKTKKENDKKQKALQEKNKEIRISLNISDHDLEIKVNHTKEFADKGCRVKFSLRLHGREGSGDSGKQYVNDFFDRVLTMFEGYNVEPKKAIGNTIWTEITK